MSEEAARPPVSDYRLLCTAAGFISIAALLFYYYHRAILLYGDAVAHINIARRVFDSRTPGIFQLGTVWLPLPHLLDIPFIANDSLWSTGLGAAIPSMAAYIAGTLGIFRLVLRMTSRGPAWIAALVYALNPNLLYMQATAMTEPLYLALFIWAVVFFSEFVAERNVDQQRARRSLERCGMMIAAAMLVRYDGWFLAFCTTVAALVVVVRAGRNAVLWRGLLNFVLLTGLTAGLWLAYNYGAFHDALAFATGPYSAKAIARQTASASMPRYPGQDSPRTATLYYLKVARLNLGEGAAQYLLLPAAFITSLAVLYFARRYSVWLLLWLPVPFYVISVAWGSVPIYFPDWWPRSYYNVRYGLQMLPAAAAFTALGCEFLGRLIPRRLSAGIVLILVASSYLAVWQKGPICLREAEANGHTKMYFEASLARELKKLPDSVTFMMDCGAHPGIFQDAGIPLSRVLNETNHPAWTIGLSAPAQAADYVIAFGGDDVSRAVRLFPQGLQLIAIVDTPGQARASIYRSLH